MLELISDDDDETLVFANSHQIKSFISDDKAYIK